MMGSHSYLVEQQAGLMTFPELELYMRPASSQENESNECNLQKHYTKRLCENWACSQSFCLSSFW